MVHELYCTVGLVSVWVVEEKKVHLIVCITLQVTTIHVKQSMIFNISWTVVIPPSLPLLMDGDEKFWMLSSVVTRSMVETSLWEAVGVKWVGGGWRQKRGGDMSSRTAQKQWRGGGGGNCGNLVIPVHLTCTIYWDAKKERGAHSMFWPPRIVAGKEEAKRLVREFMEEHKMVLTYDALKGWR